MTNILKEIILDILFNKKITIFYICYCEINVTFVAQFLIFFYHE